MPAAPMPHHAWARAILLHSCSTLWSFGVGASESPCGKLKLYDDWLSTPETFVRTDQPKGLQGLHIGCIWRGGGGSLRLEAYKNSLIVDAPEVHDLPSGAETSWEIFRYAIAKTLRVSKKTNDWGHWKYKQVFGIFGPNGKRILSVDDALRTQLVFVISGGQWFWPPVKEGFVRPLPGGMELETLSVAPVVYKINGFLKPAECEHIVDVAWRRMENSPVSLMDKDKGKAAKEFRTSTQARINRAESSVLREINSRVGMLTRIPTVHNEEVQILRYNKTQYYSSHLDNWDPSYYSDSAWFEHGHNNRFITVFWYLTTVEKGSQTVFPRAFGNPQPNDMWSCENGLKVQPKKGTVIFWYSLHPNGNTDPNGLHGACPVEDGMKWSANFWVWNKPKTHVTGDNFGEQLVQEDLELLGKDSGSSQVPPDPQKPAFAAILAIPVVAGILPYGCFPSPKALLRAARRRTGGS